MTRLSEYQDKLRVGLSLKDVGGYSLEASELNPTIFEELISFLFDSMVEAVVWEPFAGRTRQSRLMDIAEQSDVDLISQTLHPADPRIQSADSTVVGPGKNIGGVLFHPPYFGSAGSGDRRDVCVAESKESYLEALSKVVALFKPWLVKDSLVCAVGRDYRVGGQRIKLPEWYLELFDQSDYTLDEVWLSEPDVAIIFRNNA